MGKVSQHTCTPNHAKNRISVDIDKAKVEVCRTFKPIKKVLEKVIFQESGLITTSENEFLKTTPEHITTDENESLETSPGPMANNSEDINEPSLYNSKKDALSRERNKF